MSYLQALILGIVQGLTEFLPISSTGHLVLAQYYFGWGKSLPLYVDIATNIGTFLAVFVALFKDIWKVFLGFITGLYSAKGRKSDNWHLAILVIVATIPTVLIGLGLKEVFEVLNQPFYVVFALTVTGFILWFSPRSGSGSDSKLPQNLTILDALIIGIAQGLAVIPGISRSGSTIAAALWRGANPNLAAKFSFLLYVVASLGVTLLGLKEFQEVELELIPLLIMIASSFIVGYLAILGLFSLLRRGKFHWFAPYLWIVAAITLLNLLGLPN